jgi:hypothetical protein
MRITHMILKLLGLKKKPPKTKIGKILRTTERATQILILCYFIPFLFPQLLFGYSTSKHGITLYTREPIPVEASHILDKIHAKLASSVLYDKDDTFRIFLCKTKAIYWLLSPLNRYGFASSYPLTDNIVVARTNLSSNTSRTYRTTNKRFLSDVITHECGHVLIARRLGRQTAYFKPKWLQEGYCEYIAGSSTISNEHGNALIRDQWEGESVPFDYYMWRRMVEYLITCEKKDIKQLMGTPHDYTDISTKTRNWIIKKNNAEQSVAPDARTSRR